MIGAGTNKNCRLVEWVEKAAFDWLNRLFEIIAGERNYQRLLSSRNLLAVVRKPQPYVLNILPRRLPKVVVSRKHFPLRDLHFYERARGADAKARQERLNYQKERRQEGTLRRAPGEKPRASFPPTQPLKEKKKRTLVKVAKAPPSVPSFPSSFTSSVLDSSAHASEGVSSFSGHDPGACPSDLELESLPLLVIDELGVKKADMSRDLRVGFGERHHKRLYEAIDLAHHSAKRDCPEGVQEESGREIPSMPVLRRMLRGLVVH